MKLISYTVDRNCGAAHCIAAIRVQGKDTEVMFDLVDSELTQTAFNRNLGAWDEQDIATLGGPILGQQIAV